jgi:hypothetical protein
LKDLPVVKSLSMPYLFPQTPVIKRNDGEYCRVMGAAAYATVLKLLQL